MAASYSPSAATVRALRHEIDRVRRARETIAQRRAALMAQVADLDAQSEAHERRLALLGELVEVEAAMPTAVAASTPSGRVVRALKGRELRREAGRVLWQWRGNESAHYREWFERVLAAGYAVGGKDPSASFLTNVRDSPAVVRAPEQGFYRLDPDSLARVEREIAETEAELVDAERVVERAYERGGEVHRRRRDRDMVKKRLRRLRAEREELAYVFGELGEDGAERQTVPTLKVA